MGHFWNATRRCVRAMVLAGQFGPRISRSSFYHRCIALTARPTQVLGRQRIPIEKITIEKILSGLQFHDGPSAGALGFSRVFPRSFQKDCPSIWLINMVELSDMWSLRDSNSPVSWTRKGRSQISAQRRQELAVSVHEKNMRRPQSPQRAGV